MTTSPDQCRANARAARETDRQVRRLYNIAYRVAPIGRLLTNQDATADGVTYATTRIPRALSAAARLLALPNVAEHPETPYALSFLNSAEHALNAPSTRLLWAANSARAAAADAAEAGDDLRVVLFNDIEERCRVLVAHTHDGWTRHEHAASDGVLSLAAQWGLDAEAGGPHAAADAEASVPAYIAHEVARRAEIRVRCTAGIRCTRTTCLAYGAVWTHDSTGLHCFLCIDCIPAENADCAARGLAPSIQPVPGGVATDARYTVTLYNGSGPGHRTVTCDTPQEAQFTAETLRPYNNTGYEIHVAIHP